MKEKNNKCITKQPRKNNKFKNLLNKMKQIELIFYKIYKKSKKLRFIKNM